MKIFSLICISLLATSTAFCTHASTHHPLIDSLEWRLKKTTEHIKIYSAKVPDSKHKAILSVTTVKATPDSIIQLIRNPQTCTQWVYRCKRSVKYQAINAQEEYIYTATHMPFPTRSRDILAHIHWQTDPKTQIVTATGTATTNVLTPQKGHTRIKHAKMIWEITPLNNGETQIRNYGHIDPAGGIPAWLSNRLSVKIPFKTLAGLREALGEK